ncbi:MAG: T9SS type A sorting domain-containing protein, partial [Ignavibacteria bacterium]|nr:T9SS type A sorting domain-containing protein [Ignavibacteria bacterium]
GSYNVKFDGSNLSSGIYIYKLSTENFSETKRMMLIK